jgi:hypothetical protein
MSQSPFNPFEAPQTKGALTDHPTGTLDLGAALSAGWDATWRNFGPWLAVVLIGGVLSMVSVVTVIGIFFVLPVLLWGGVKFTINTVDGQAKVEDLFAGFNDYWKSLGPMLVLMGVYLAVNIVSQVISFAAGFMGGDVAAAGAGILLILVFLALMILGPRFMFAPYLIVDARYGGIEALGESWRATAHQKLNVVLLQILWVVITILGLLLLIIGVIPATMIVYSTWAAAYRQLRPTIGGTTSAF